MGLVQQSDRLELRKIKALILRWKVQYFCGCYTNTAIVAPSTGRGTRESKVDAKGNYAGSPVIVIKGKETPQEGSTTGSIRATKAVRFEINEDATGVGGVETSSDHKLPYITIHLKVGMHCDGCKQKVVKALSKLDEVRQIDISMKRQKVDVSGYINPEKVIEAIQKTGKQVEYWLQENAGNFVPSNDHGTQCQQEDPHAAKSSCHADQLPALVQQINSAPSDVSDGVKEDLKPFHGETAKAGLVQDKELQSDSQSHSSRIDKSSQTRPAHSDPNLDRVKVQESQKLESEKFDPKEKTCSCSACLCSHAAPKEDDPKLKHEHLPQNACPKGIDFEASASQLPSSEVLTEDGSNTEKTHRTALSASNDLISSVLQELMTASLNIKAPREAATNKRPPNSTVKQDHHTAVAAHDQCCSRDRSKDQYTDHCCRSRKSEMNSCSHRHRRGKSESSSNSGIVSQGEKFASSITDVLLLVRRDSAAPSPTPNMRKKPNSRH